MRAYAETLKGPKYDSCRGRGQGDRWEKAGDTEKAAKLRSYAATLPRTIPSRKARSQWSRCCTRLDAEELDAPTGSRNSRKPTKILKGPLPAVENFPQVSAQLVMGQGGGGKSGGARYRPTLSRFRQGGYLRRHRRRDGGRPRRWNESLRWRPLWRPQPRRATISPMTR